MEAQKRESAPCASTKKKWNEYLRGLVIPHYSINIDDADVLAGTRLVLTEIAGLVVVVVVVAVVSAAPVKQPAPAAVLPESQGNCVAAAVFTPAKAGIKRTTESANINFFIRTPWCRQ